eukprot:CAMPEP_0118686302 /NCGR_PEP_ID=MMETSP0800-20121206/7736_1 /TAXON_ID=210618 ORGANISM="Striatella unipunctata, Strain CCMP2910" /NCGR_SAMPLE_ID=MMETSP0800 /ASSEMBLY_ACC=CAM_ASM_000638 /LENGTH=745 /DNA_ID=CAMNT_0006583329 /DNA_START=55 /DNA_END=2292 /DNA_ORIENTATION=-
MTMIQLHAGQRRYHDFAKLRQGHRARSGQHHYAEPLTIAFSNQEYAQFFAKRPFIFGALSQRYNNMTLKMMERDANMYPDHADKQYNFLSALAEAQYYQAIVQRVVGMPEYTLDERCAYLFLQAVQQTNSHQIHFDLNSIVQRLQKNGTTNPNVIEDLQELAKNRPSTKATALTKAMSILSSGAGAMATGAIGSTSMPSIGIDPKKPLFVSIARPSAGSGIGSFIGRAVLTIAGSLIIVSALSAILDEKGVGRSLGGGMNSKHIQEAEGSNIKFDDVKGVAEAKHELEEIVHYLRDPSKFTRLGGKLPRGVLLTGPPGTGKTLLAKAIAGEADVPFFYASGSSFEEVYVGVGAKRVRDLFEAAKKKSPAIIFIDEVDAVGGSRKLKDQSALKMTLNELLVQLDGFDENNGIIVIGATNFKESLDSALLRPGRFDKHVDVPLPDVGGRKEILELYAKKTKLSKDVDLSVLARGTTGFSGADLFNLMNQAALKASVDGLNCITMSVLEYAKDKILMGAERKTAIITPETAKCTAYHEAGHALVAILTEGAQPIHKATIMPRGSSLGMVTMLPEGDQTSQSLKQMLAFMDVAMGGRVAEELSFGRENVTSGAVSDIASATRLARAMVTKYGFSPEVGIVYHSGDTGEDSASASTRAKIDEEVKRLTDSSYERATNLLKKYAKEHELLAETLLEYETLTGDEVRELINYGRKPKRPIIRTQTGQTPSKALGSRMEGKKSTIGRALGSRQ